MPQQPELFPEYANLKRPDPETAPEPVSSVARNAVKKAVRGKLTEMEIKRLEKMCRNVDWMIDSMMRNRRIIDNINKLHRKGCSITEASHIVGEKFYLSFERIQMIYYYENYEKPKKNQLASVK